MRKDRFTSINEITDIAMDVHFVEPKRTDSFGFYFIALPGVVIGHYSMILKLDEYTFVVDF